ncbi:hypothetical protein B1748_09105 [Paenibacillus sp. MY03]|uniref:hypothetical protein n=1 Tax=Paenibacillus sp. MY03 TaxID=302980 RepID=UPI000B3D35D3|nr:hypothetical protein [Paenibacillus sp. MY03]OUS77289.1 hypothetical protein B1748_09105 [Paenibacillus sp. MY03]
MGFYANYYAEDESDQVEVLSNESEVDDSNGKCNVTVNSVERAENMGLIVKFTIENISDEVLRIFASEITLTKKGGKSVRIFESFTAGFMSDLGFYELDALRLLPGDVAIANLAFRTFDDGYTLTYVDGSDVINLVMLPNATVNE